LGDRAFRSDDGARIPVIARLAMAKLSSLKPRLGGLSPYMATPTRQQAEKVRLRERDRTTDWRSLYSTQRWQRLRAEVLLRDGYTCQRTGDLLTGKSPAPDSPVVHHKKPHRGDETLFWDKDNLETVSKAWHDSVAQAMEHADKVAAIHPKWLKPSIIPLTIICGPPAAGKSTYAKQHAGPRDIIIDLDVIASEISGEPVHAWDRDAWLNAALYRRNDMLGSLSRPSTYKAAWLIVSEPKAKHRQWWADTLRPQSIIVIETPEAECIARLHADGRAGKRIIDAVVRWWFEYEPRRGDQRA
jgi:5-methylcytosine-specific restriction endonuclease McrA